MATYRDPQLRDQLAAEYVLGTLSGRTRARFRNLLKYDPPLRQLVAEWELRLTPLAAAAEEIAPPARLWQRIAAGIGPRPSDSWWSNLLFWRTSTVTAAAAVLALSVYIGMLPQ